jgi:hypothetical protein
MTVRPLSASRHSDHRAPEGAGVFVWGPILSLILWALIVFAWRAIA